MMRWIVKLLRFVLACVVNTSLLLLSCVFSLLLLEQGFRLWLFGWHAFDKEAMMQNTMIGNSGLVQQSPYPEIHWALKPNLDVVFKFARLQTNSFGMADKEYPLEKEQGVYRVAVLGDSYTQASGVDTDKAYHALLESRFNAELSAESAVKEYQFLNFGLGGFNLQRYNEVLKYLVPQWQPDALLIGFCGMNDHEEIQIHTTPQPFNPFPLNGFYRSYIAMYFNNVNFQPEEVASAYIDDKAYQFVDAQFARLRAQADAIRPGMPILLAYLDNRERAESDKQRLAELAARYQMEFVDASAPFKNTELSKYSLHIFDSHPNTEANVIFADILQQHLQQAPWFTTSAAKTEYSLDK